MSTFFAPPAIGRGVDLQGVLSQQGYVVVGASLVSELADVAPGALLSWQSLWDDLPADAYLRDGGRYRRRRHACFVVDGFDVRQMPHRPHWQPLAYNALHGGMQRHFEPIKPSLVNDPTWQKLLLWLGQECSRAVGARAWFIEAHQFRIDTTDGIGRPTPEGAHRDGVDFVAVFLMNRVAVKGGETRVFEADGPNGQRFTLTEPGSVLLLNDERVIHESTPIQPVTSGGYRDTLVITLRRNAFLGDDNTPP